MHMRYRLAICTSLIALAMTGSPAPVAAQDSPWSRLAICDAAFSQHRYRTTPLQPGENINTGPCAARRDACLAAAGSDPVRRSSCLISYDTCIANGQGVHNQLQSGYGFGVIAECYANSYVDPGDLSATYCDSARAVRDIGILEWQGCQYIADPDTRLQCGDAAMTKAWLSSGVMNCE